MQQPDNILPRYINLDTAYESLNPDESPFIKNLEDNINGNPDAGSNNPTGEGQNAYTLTPIRSNKKLNIELPAGINLQIGPFESVETQELYWFNHNSNGDHGIYLEDGNTGLVSTVIIDPELGFSDDPGAYIAEHRVSLRCVFDKQKRIVQKFLLWTDGNKWQGWINVNTAISTNGFDAGVFPYFKLMPPHFDRRELLEWAIRKPMYNPKAVLIPNTDADRGKVNRMIDTVFQFSQVYNNTDGRSTELSPYSLPLIVNTTDFLNNPDNVPKNAVITMYAGSCMTESIDLYVRSAAKQQAGIVSAEEWGPWRLYKRIYKFGPTPNVLATPYWTRLNPWAGLGYDTTFNTIQFLFDNSEQGTIPVIDTTKLQNDIPQLSIAHVPLGNSEALASNRYNYDNFSATQLANLDAEVAEKPPTVCKVELATITLYGYIGMCDTDFTYKSQVGYIIGTDPTVRFGGLRQALLLTDNKASVDVNESKFFGLDLADKKGFRIYAKGTPYFADATWIIVNTDNSITDLPDTIDLSSNDTLQFIQNIFEAGGYLAMRWKLRVPHGRYDIAVGRHSVSSSGDYRNTSTYIKGIASSRVKSSTAKVSANGPYQLVTIKPNALVNGFSKEMEIDCSAGDVDVWGNGKDLFYVYCPYNHSGGGPGHFRFIEGYFQESSDNPIPVEMFPYQMTHNNMDDGGGYTDKNGFYFAYTKANDSPSTDIQFVARVNCAYPTTFTIPTSATGDGWKQNKTAYLSDNNGGVVGDCNRVIYRGRITSLDGLIGYSNISVSIADGMTVQTKTDGTFELIIHNGQINLRVSNVYINAGGNFNITIANCGQVPLFNFDEALVPCVNCQMRVYPIQILLGVNAEGGTIYSLKENATYGIGCACADLAGRLTYVNVIKYLTVPSFLERNDILATFFRLLVKGQLKFESDLKWFAPYVTNQLTVLKYLQWVGDKIKYIDSNGNVVSDPASAVFCAIYIDSFYNNNLANNFSLLANYQFTPEDRIRVLDDGEGNLLDTGTFGDPIDLQILGTNYNQAAMAASIIPNTANPVVNVNNTTNATSITLYVRYDARLDKLIKDTGFWIELYTPVQQREEIPFNEMEWKPVMNGEIADFTGFNNNIPQYNYPVAIDIPFWDTYLFSRNISIPGVGDKFLGHYFESPNISDSWGYHITSGGRRWVKNDNGRQQWYLGDVIKSNVFLSESLINGLGTFDSKNRKDFSQYKWGAIVAMLTQRGVVLFICENDFFTTNFDFHFAYANEQGVMVTNLDQGMSEPFQKIGDNYGCAQEFTGSIGSFDKVVWWYDIHNAAMVICNYKTATDVSEIKDDKGRQYGVKSYFIAKSQFIGNWNKNHEVKDRFDVVTGVDMVRKNILITFRPRRNNTNDLTSYRNQRRNWQLDYQETLVYSMDSARWTKATGFTPEGYGKLRGSKSGVELYSFAAGVPYAHNNTGNDSYLEFFGAPTEKVLVCLLNKLKEVVKILENVAYDSTQKWFIDMIYTTQDNSYSYVPLNYMDEREKLIYAPVLRDMVSYLAPNPDEAFRSTLLDGKRLFSVWFYVRFVGDPNKPIDYSQLSDIYYLVTNSPSSNKK